MQAIIIFDKLGNSDKVRGRGRASGHGNWAAFIKVAGKRRVGRVSRRHAAGRTGKSEDARASRFIGGGRGSVAQRERQPGPR